MRKDIFLPGLAVGCGILGFGLRWWQWSAGYDQETQLFLAGHPAFYALLLLAAVGTALLLLALRGIPRAVQEANPFRCPSPIYITVMTAAALLFLAAGALGLLEGISQLSLWRAAPDSHPLTYPAALLLCALLAFPAGAAALLLGRSGYRGEPSPALPLLVNFPPLSALAWVFASHLVSGTDPILLRYGVALAAAVFLLLAHYYVAAFFHEQPHPFRAAFTALVGAALGLTALADRPALFQCAMTGACVLSALANTWVLLRNTYGPPWPKRLLEERMPFRASEENGSAGADDDDDIF